MTREINGYVSDLPLGCITETDIYTDKGALLCQKMTVVDNHLLDKISHYHGKIHAVISYVPDEPVITVVPEPDTSIKFDQAFKKYAEETLKNILKNVDDVKALTQGAREVGEQVYSIIENSNELIVNLSKLKISDEYTYKHSIDVGTMAAVLAKYMGETDKFVHDIAIAGLLHDVGKEKIPAEIIQKPAKLTAEEYEIIKRHPLYAYKLLMDSKDLSEKMLQGILNHHENVDGTGYPRGLSGKQIGKMAQILSIVDVYDALVTKRSYKDAKSPAQAIEIMFTMSNKFNIDYFKAFLDVIITYPNGSEVLLSTGETATVMKQNKSYPLRPVIKVAGSDKSIDLANDSHYLSTVIINFANAS